MTLLHTKSSLYLNPLLIWKIYFKFGLKIKKILFGLINLRQKLLNRGFNYINIRKLITSTLKIIYLSHQLKT